jgi:hypothetical protein
MYRKGRARRDLSALSPSNVLDPSQPLQLDALLQREGQAATTRRFPPRASRPAILIGVFPAIRLTPFRRAGFVDAALMAGAAFFLAQRESRAGAPPVFRARADSAHTIREWRVDELFLSRLETEWLVAWFYDRSRQMPSQVQERLKSIGFIDGDNLTAAGRRWLQTRGPVPLELSR